MTNYQLTLPIVLIEDNPVDLDLTIRAFKKRKLDNPIKIGRDGEEAIALFEQWPLDEPLPVLILLDINLPKYSGFEVLQKIKSQQRFLSVPVVILTASAVDKDMKRAYELGANSYIVKPIDFDKFMHVAEEIEVYWILHNKTYLD